MHDDEQITFLNRAYYVSCYIIQINQLIIYWPCCFISSVLVFDVFTSGFYTKHEMEMEIIRFSIITLNILSDMCAHILIIGQNIAKCGSIIKAKWRAVWELKEPALMAEMQRWAEWSGSLKRGRIPITSSVFNQTSSTRQVSCRTRR